MKKIILLIFLCISFVYAKSQNWSAVPGWQSSYGSPTAVTKHQGSLWAGSAQGIYKYNGSSWELTSSPFLIRDIRCLYSDGTNLYAGGLFTFATYQALVLKWNGTSWDPFGYTDNTASGVWIGAILKTPTKLYIGGFFNNIGATPGSLSNLGFWASFDGVSWTQPFSVAATGCASSIESIQLINDSIYVAGGFYEINSTWTPATFRFKEGWGMSSLDGYGFCYLGRDCQVFQNILYIGGRRRHDTVNVDIGITKRVGNNWISLASNMQLINTRVIKLLGKMYIAGAPGGGLNGIATNICSYNGTTFINEGIGVSYPAGSVYPSIYCMFADTLSNKLYVGGSFLQSNGNVADYFAVKNGYGLPVQLSNFDARLGFNNEVLLSWKDQTPSNQNRFEVQASTDGVHFFKIGSVTGNDYLNAYSFHYRAPRCGQYYFRLMLDNDNTKYSQVRPIDISCPGPKIVAGKQSLYITTSTPGTLILINPSGQTLARTVIASGYTSVPLSVPFGIYIVKFIDNRGSVYSQKIVVQ